VLTINSLGAWEARKNKQRQRKILDFEETEEDDMKEMSA